LFIKLDIEIESQRFMVSRETLTAKIIQLPKPSFLSDNRMNFAAARLITKLKATQNRVMKRQVRLKYFYNTNIAGRIFY